MRTGLSDNPYSLHGRVAVVTGAARGIGRAAALRLARAGADVVVLDRDLAGARDFDETLTAATVPLEIQNLGCRSAGHEVDLTDAAATRAVMATVEEQFGAVDILVCVAGGNFHDVRESLPSKVPVDDWHATIDVNLNTTFHSVQAVIPAMRRAGGGSIITTTSFSGLISEGSGMLAAYGAAKAGVVNFTRNVARELGVEGIRANCVSPGWTATSRLMSQGGGQDLMAEKNLERMALRRFGEPDEVARAMEFLASDMSSYISGQVLSVCGGYAMFAH